MKLPIPKELVDMLEMSVALQRDMLVELRELRKDLQRVLDSLDAE